MTLTPEAAAVGEAGLNVLESHTTAVLAVEDTFYIAGGGEAPFTAATIWFNANARDVAVAVVPTNRADGSADTVVYPTVASVRRTGSDARGEG